jgi:bacteriorhodopsin
MLAEVAIVWTFYGLGYVFLIAVVMLLVKGLLKLVESRRAADE